MPIYVRRCRSCDATFEVNRPMAQADDPAPCPDGHEDTVRVVTGLNIGGHASAGTPKHTKVRKGDAAPPH